MSTSDLYTVVAQDHRQPPFTIGTYGSLEKAEAAVSLYFGVRCQKDRAAVPHSLACVSTWRLFETNVYVMHHELDEPPRA